MVVLHFEPATKKLPTSLNEIQSSKMKAKAFLTCHSLSHPFQERVLTLDQAVKIGRSMARARPSPNNAIFDCKVLSRNHALLWYDNGKFFLQDTKSSNGTFVNNHRLSKGSEESLPREIFSGDVLQFGVTVIENSRKGKAIHDCIIATVKLLLPDGNEAKASPSTAVLPAIPSPGALPTQDLYQLSLYIQEALYREQMLETKLGILEKVVQNSKEASENGWKVLIDEDRLLTRLEILESQLQTYSKNFPDDKLREEISKLQEDKNTYQMTAKESLMKVLQEKLDAIKKMKDVERTLTNTQSEYAHFSEVYEKTKEELQELATKFNQQVEEIKELKEKLQETEDRLTEENKKMENEKNSLQEKVAVFTKQEELLKSQVESLQVDNDITKQQLAATKANLGIIHQKMNEKEKVIQLELTPPANPEEMTENQNEVKSIIIPYKNDENEANLSPVLGNHVGDHEDASNKKLQVEIEKLNELLAETREKKNNTEAEVIRYKGELEGVNDSVKKHVEEVQHLRQLLQQAQQVAKEKSDTVADLQEQLNKTELSMKQQVTLVKERLSEEQERLKEKQKETSSLQKQLLETQQNNKQSHNEAEQLRNKIKSLTEELKRVQEMATRNSSPDENLEKSDYLKLREEYTSLKNRLQHFELEIRKTRNENAKLTAEYTKTVEAYKQLQTGKKSELNVGDVLAEIQEDKPDTDSAREQLLEAQEEIIQLKLKFSQCNEEKTNLKEILTKLDEDYQLLSYQTRTISACSIIPLIFLALGIVFAFYPTLAKLTATVESPHPP